MFSSAACSHIPPVSVSCIDSVEQWFEWITVSIFWSLWFS